MLRAYFTNDVYALLILLSVSLIVTAKLLFETRFRDYLDVVINVRYLKLYSRDQKKIDVFNTILTSNFYIILALFTYTTYSIFAVELSNSLEVLPIIIAFIILVFFGKWLLEKFVGYIFGISPIIKLYLFQKTTFKNYTGLILIPLCVLLLFSPIDEKSLIYLGFFAILSINLIGFARFLKLYQKAILANFFYFLLYLCALEIGPYVILYKVIKDYFV